MPKKRNLLLSFLCCSLFVDQFAPSKEQLHAPLHLYHLIQTQQETNAALDCMIYSWDGIPHLKESEWVSWELENK